MGPKLRKRLPEATEAIQHNDIHKPQGRLLGHTGGKHLGYKNERVHHQRYRTRTQALLKITRRIEIF